MKIGIFETEHFEGAYPVIKLFDTPQNQLHIFTDRPTYRRFTDLLGERATRYQWTILQSGFSRVQFFRQFYRAAKQFRPDILYINTISSNHILFALVIRLLAGSRTVITIHDINCLYHDRPSLHPRKLAHYLGKRLLIRWVKEFNVVSDTMIPYLQQQTNGGKVIHNVPGAVFDGRQHAAPATGPFHLVVPGTLDRKRRDYSQVWHLLQAAERRQFPLQVTLLGGYTDGYGKRVIAEARDFPCYYTHVHFYDAAVVDQDEFDRQLNQAHFVFIPSVVNTTICHSIPEVYGLTKSSGNIFDVIKHAKPFIVPASLQVPASLHTSVLTYQEAGDLLSLLQSVQQEPDRYAALTQAALRNSQEYTLEKVRSRNPALFTLPA